MSRSSIGERILGSNQRGGWRFGASAASTRPGDRTGMSWLIESNLATAGQPKRRHQAEALLADLFRELEPLGAQLFDRRANVLAHQVQLVVGIAVGGMGG